MSEYPVKLLFFGGKSWGVHALRILMGLKGHTQRNFELLGVVSNNGDMKELVYSENIVAEASAMKIPIFLPQTKQQILELVMALKPDFGLSVFFDRIIPVDALELFPMGAANLHMGDAELFHGCFSTMHVLAQGLKEAGVTLHYMDAGIDTGDIIAKTIWQLELGISGYELYMQSLSAGMEILANELPKLIDGISSRRSQNVSQVKHYPRELPKKEFSSIDIRENPDFFINSVLAHDFPGFSGVRLSLDGAEYEIIRRNPYSKLHSK